MTNYDILVFDAYMEKVVVEKREHQSQYTHDPPHRSRLLRLVDADVCRLLLAVRTNRRRRRRTTRRRRRRRRISTVPHPPRRHQNLCTHRISSHTMHRSIGTSIGIKTIVKVNKKYALRRGVVIYDKLATTQSVTRILKLWG